MWTEARLGINSASKLSKSLKNPSFATDRDSFSLLLLSTSDFTKPYYYFQNRSVDATAAAAGCTFDATAATTG